MNKLAFVFFPFFLISTMATAQDTLKKVKFLPVPTIGYSPETKTYVGAVTLFTFHLYNDSVTRTSNAKLEVTWTWNHQMVLGSEWNYFFREEKWFTKGVLQYSKYPDYYYGVGSNTPDNNQVLYNSNRIVFEAHVLKRAGKKFFIGGFVKYNRYMNVANRGNITYPELTENSNAGFGITLLKDTRDNLLTPSSGLYFNFSSGYNFLDHHYGETSIDLRYYKSMAGRFTWANRVINEFTFGHPPFYNYSFLGGDMFVRGYTYGRYRDNHLSSYQTEFRFPVIWRIGMAGFGGVSWIYHAKDFRLADEKYNYGLGLRFLVDKHDRTSLRMDYALGKDHNSGFYISFGESF